MAGGDGKRSGAIMLAARLAAAKAAAAAAASPTGQPTGRLGSAAGTVETARGGCHDAGSRLRTYRHP
ncbi:MAG: hypothetical protein WDW38_009577 [Sanguina aurantia]